MADLRVKLVDACARAVGGQEVCVPALKVAMMSAYRLLPADERRAFVRHLSPDGEFIRVRVRWPGPDGEPTDQALENAASHWGYIHRDLFERDEKLSGLSRSIQILLKQNCKPSEKQGEFMKRGLQQWRRWKAFRTDPNIERQVRDEIEKRARQAVSDDAEAETK